LRTRATSAGYGRYLDAPDLAPERGVRFTLTLMFPKR
jgi:hypothetical protein